MANIAIVYWTGSGNTEAMANAIDEGAKAAGSETQLSFVTDVQWMDDWAGRVAETGADIVADPVKAYAYPDDDALEACRQLGAALANA